MYLERWRTFTILSIAPPPPAIVTQGGKTIWLAGQTTLVDLEGNSIAHNFEAQARTCFALIDQTLKRVGGTLADLVTMTVSIDDPRHGDHFIEIRHEHFPDGRFPCSALITVSNFAHPGILIRNSGGGGNLISARNRASQRAGSRDG